MPGIRRTKAGKRKRTSKLHCESILYTHTHTHTHTVYDVIHVQ